VGDSHPAPPPPGERARRPHDAGGLWIADEVQGGHGRSGDALWSYQRLGIRPDVITLGKPMGNGHPVAAVLTRRDIAERFGATTDFFSTFGGNPVAMAAAQAVLDVIDDERVLDRVRLVGGRLVGRLRDLAATSPLIAEVRGIGLAIGVEIVRPGTLEPDAGMARAIVEGMRERGVLIGTTGRHRNALKIRPPLVVGIPEVDLLVATLADALGSVGSPGRQ
jgi:4-aminobutyrate aminotransferase-like enzyme